MPHRDTVKAHRWNLGWVSDRVCGVAEAYVVFLLLVTEIGNQQADGSTLLRKD